MGEQCLALLIQGKCSEGVKLLALPRMSIPSGISSLFTWLGLYQAPTDCAPSHPRRDVSRHDPFAFGVDYPHHIAIPDAAPSGVDDTYPQGVTRLVVDPQVIILGSVLPEEGMGRDQA